MDQVEEVKQKTDIVALINEYVPLKKAGRNYKGLCPFHQEKTPSFMVSPELQIYKCFGCSESGDAYSFLEKYEGMEFYEALKSLAERAGIKLKPIGDRQYSEKEKLLAVNDLAGKFYNYILTKHAAGRQALGYVVKKRGITSKTITTFGIGFAPNIPSLLSKFLVTKKKFSGFDLERSGLAFRGREGVLDRFRGRIIFPLYDHRGNCIGLAGRILPEYEQSSGWQSGKYINSPETPVYHKGNVLYGLHITRSEIKHQGFAVVVEGEIDLISSWQAGIKNIVAIKGTALTPEQVRVLSRLTGKLVLALDADLAGDSAARRGIEIAQGQGLEVRVARMGKYKDPDEFARGDPGGLAKAIGQAENIWDFLIDVVFAKHDAATGAGKAKISREITPILAGIEDKIVQAHYIALVAKKLGVSPEVVTGQVEKVSLPAGKQETKSQEKKETKGRRELVEERLLALSLSEKPEFILKEETASLFTTPWTKKILREYRIFMEKSKKFSLSAFVKTLSSELSRGLSEALLIEEEGGYAEKELPLLVRELEELDLKEKLSRAKEKIQEKEEAGKGGELTKAKEEFALLSKRLAQLEE